MAVTPPHRHLPHLPAMGRVRQRSAARICLVAPLGAREQRHPLLSCQPSPRVRTAWDRIVPFRKMSGLGNPWLVCRATVAAGHNRSLAISLVQAIAKQPLSHFDQMMVLSEPRGLGTQA